MKLFVLALYSFLSITAPTMAASSPQLCRTDLQELFEKAGIIFQSKKMFAVADLVEVFATLAPESSVILIQGRNGTGKGGIAKAIHQLSRQSARAFEVVDFNVPDTLIEDALFGHKKGSYTGAISDQPGAFERAHGGTVFLDDIQKTSLALQGKLLRVLEEREYRKLGDIRMTPVGDVRIVVATNEDLAAKVRDGTFREDLFYRLNVLPIHLPTLRERQEDIPAIARYLLEKHSIAAHGNLIEISDQAFAALSAYDWPGNIRQLDNVIERSVILAKRNPTHTILSRNLLKMDGDVLPSDGDDSEIIGELNLDLVIAAHIAKVLRQSGYVFAKAASLLGMKRTTLAHQFRVLARDGFLSSPTFNDIRENFPRYFAPNGEPETEPESEIEN